MLKRNEDQNGAVIFRMSAGEEESVAERGTGQTCLARVLGRQPKIYSPIPGQLGALCHGSGATSLCSKPMNRKNDFDGVV